MSLTQAERYLTTKTFIAYNMDQACRVKDCNAGVTPPSFARRSHFDALRGRECELMLTSGTRRTAVQSSKHQFAGDRADLYRGKNIIVNQSEPLLSMIEQQPVAEPAVSDTERLDAYFGASASLRYRISADWSEMLELVGRDFLCGTTTARSQWLIDFIPAGERVRVRKAIEDAVAARAALSLKHRLRRADGTWAWMHSRVVPVLGSTGEIKEWFGTSSDVTASHTADAAIRDSERRFRLLLEGMPQLVWRAIDHGLWIWASPQWTKFTGQSERDSRDWGWLDMVHPDDRAATRAAWARANVEDGFSAEYRLRMAEEPRYRWFSTRAMPVCDETGELIEWVGTSTDIDDLRRLQNHQQILLGELQHRVRNSLAVIRSIAHRTAQTSDTVEEFSIHLDGRLGAFARSQAAVTSDPTAGLDLHSIVSGELLAHLAHEGEHTEIDGSDIKLRPKAGETLALAFHELASNAVKYGALSVPDGTIEVSWRIVTDDGGSEQLAIVWVEHRPGKALSPPGRRGFGTELLEDTLHYELEADTLLDFQPAGLHCSIIIPFTEQIGSRA